ncbi:Mov34/MPN/PAD-1 family protein [Streptomyces mirabilis]|uniref:JAB domain-containing protein n=1 Tax=Streptomyces mirabilis TaxID=68239 RepID=A0A1I2VKV5_9ACTN|nr:Mov34/MPN/PAD-1 family protein [Streptomyces mirabilis]SFG89792.1 JAB domain-containing protein [Streptomyces mirabilis]
MEYPIVQAPAALLRELVNACRDFLERRGGFVECGGLLIGSFDGLRCSVESLILDDQAISTPISIVFSPEVFERAQRTTSAERKGHDNYERGILGTWHGHPPSHGHYSSTDEATLFQEQMRIRTDDPALALSPRVHIIIPNYGLDIDNLRVFTMQVRPQYRIERLVDFPPLHLESAEEIRHSIEGGSNLGLLVSRNQEGPPLRLERYHPKQFLKHEDGEISIVGLWKYFPYSEVVHEFEKVFLENYYQKTRMEKFLYVRVLQSFSERYPSIGWYDCSRSASESSSITSFVELDMEVAEG